MNYSVIIPTHNRPDLVVRAIRSVYAQTCPPLEVLVIDDASQPPLVLPEDLCDGRTRVIRHERSVGGAQARNTGLSEAPTPIVAFLDDDDEWLPAKMEIQLAWLRDHPDATLVTCGHLRCEGGQEYLEVFTQEFVERYHEYDNFFGSFSYLVIRRSPGGAFLDPALPALQDWDFALRVTRYSSFGVIEQPLVKYYAHDLPRITNRPGNHLRGLRHCYLKHRLHVSVDARRWLLGRVVFERSRCIASAPARLRRVAFSIRLAAGCRVPLIMKLRVIARRAASLAVSPRTVVAIRSAAIASWQGLRRVTGSMKLNPPQSLPQPVPCSPPSPPLAASRKAPSR
jgi:glycosyltransferase involved in cell wall biosynthesis